MRLHTCNILYIILCMQAIDTSLFIVINRVATRNKKKIKKKNCDINIDSIKITRQVRFLSDLDPDIQTG